MSWMFSGATKFNCDLRSWDVRSVIERRGMFSGAYRFNFNFSPWKDDQRSLEDWFMISVVKMFIPLICCVFVFIFYVVFKSLNELIEE